MSIDYDVLLLPVFQEMRRLGADVSLKEYLQALQTVRNGVGLEDAALLAESCRLLWAKSREEQEIFDIAFAEKAIPKLFILAVQPEPRSDNKTTNSAHDHVLSKKDKQEFSQQERE